MPNEGKNILATYGGTLVLQGAALENFGDRIPHTFLERARNHSKPSQQFPKLCLTAWVSPFQANVSTQMVERKTGAPARGTGGLGWNTDAASRAKTPTPALLPSAPLRAAFLPPLPRGPGCSWDSSLLLLAGCVAAAAEDAGPLFVNTWPRARGRVESHRPEELRGEHAAA